MTENSDKLDNMTVRRFAKLIKGNSTSNGSTGITTGTVIQNDNQLYVAVDDETLVPVSDTASNVNVGDKVTLAIDNEEALIVGNNSDASPTASELSETDTKATFAKVDASEAKDTAQTAQTTADNAQSTATEAKETADAVDGKATEAKETATQAQATATTASETATQAKETAEAVDAKATEAQSTATEAQTTANTAQTTANTAKETADTASTKADNAQSTADTANTKADNAQTTADTASSKADTAQTTAETAQARAEGAEKMATNFIDIDDNKGITVGDMTAGALGKNTYINNDGVSIRDGETVLASFKENQISLGQNSFDSTIQFNNGLSTISANKYGTTQWDTKGLELNANNSEIVLKGKSDTGGAGFQLGERAISCIRCESSLYTDLIPLEISIFSNIIYLGKFLSETSARTGVEIEFKDDGTISLEAPKLIQDGKQVSVVGHNHAGDALTPASINTTSTIKQNGTQVSLEGHTHSASDVTSGTLPIARGGTGATTASDARSAIGAAASSHNHSASNITSGTLAVARGGTGKTSGTFYGETVLYNNTTGTNGNVTLSASAANYTYLEIFYKCTASNSLAYNSVKVFSPNGKKVQLQQSFFASGTTTLQTDFELVSISTTTITRGTMGYIQHSGSASGCGTTTRQFNIVRVVGYK